MIELLFYKYLATGKKVSRGILSFHGFALITFSASWITQQAIFLDATTPCPPVVSARRSVGPSVRRSVPCYFRMTNMAVFEGEKSSRKTFPKSNFGYFFNLSNSPNSTLWKRFSLNRKKKFKNVIGDDQQGQITSKSRPLAAFDENFYCLHMFCQ